MDILITAFIGFVSTIISGWVTYFFTRKKYNSEVDGNLISNMQKSLVFYTELSNDNSKRLENILNDYETLRGEFETVLKENNNLRAEIVELKTNIKSLTREIKNLNTKRNGTKTT